MAEIKQMGTYEKLMIVQQTLKAPKNQFNSFGKYKYRSCEDILEGLKPCLKEVKAVVTIDDEIVEIGGRIYVKATANFRDTEAFEATISNTAYAREPETKSGMDQAQITGATSSYARKYALNGLFMIDDTKDADTDEAHNEANAKSKTRSAMNDVKKQHIDGKKQQALVNKCSADNVKPSVILERFKVENFAQLTEEQLSYIVANWTKEFKGGE